VDSNGFPNALSAGSGLAVTLTASAVPFLLSFAAGFDSNGNVDFLSQITTNQTFSGLTANSTLYLCVDRSPTTGTLTLGFSGSGTAYSNKAPTAPATGATWFDLNAFVMKQWSGSAWVALQRIIIGEATTGAGTVTSVTTYAYRGFYQSAWVAVIANTDYVFNHNLGIPLLSANASTLIFAGTSGADFDAAPATPALNVGGTDYGYQQRYPSGGTGWKTLTINTKANPAYNSANVWQTTGFYKVVISRGW
jgi:hypothetical protein